MDGWENAVEMGLITSDDWKIVWNVVDMVIDGVNSKAMHWVKKFVNRYQIIDRSSAKYLVIRRRVVFHTTFSDFR